MDYDKLASDWDNSCPRLEPCEVDGVTVAWVVYFEKEGSSWQEARKFATFDDAWDFFVTV
jgi:hypothetical protein